MEKFITSNAKVLQFLAAIVAWATLSYMIYFSLDTEKLSDLLLPTILYVFAVFEGYTLRILTEKKK